MKCATCSSPLLQGERFCQECGAETTTPSSGNSQQKTKLTQWHTPLLLVIALFCAGILLQNFLLVHNLRDFSRKIEGLARNTSTPPGSQQHLTNNEAWAHPRAPIVFSALQNPCGKCDIEFIQPYCDGSIPGGGKAATKKLINQLFRDGKSKKEVLGFFMESCGFDILTPQAQAIYRKQHPQ